jgi:hypothetical protein
MVVVVMVMPVMVIMAVLILMLVMMFVAMWMAVLRHPFVVKFFRIFHNNLM